MIQNEKGLTLIEILVSVVILGVVLVLFLNLSASTRNAETASNNQYAALTIAEQAISTIRTEALQNPTQMPTYTSTDAKYKVEITSLQVSSTPSSAIAIPKPVGSNTHSVSMETIVNLDIGSQYSPYILNATVSWGDS